MDIEKISQQELLDDRSASLADIAICELALLHNVQYYSSGSVKRRRDINKMIIIKINMELERRRKET